MNIKTTNKQFRISAKRIFLTYSQVLDELTFQEVLQQLQQKHNIFRYVVAEERHKDQGKHFHVLLESAAKFDIRNPQNLDISFQDHVFHGNYQAAKSYKKVASYITKDNHYITNYPNLVNGEFISVEQDMVRVAPVLGPKKASQYFLQNYPKNALKGMNVRNSESYIQAINQVNKEPSNVEQVAQETLPFQLKDFALPDKLNNWVQQGCQPTLLLVGDAGTYKTSFCKTLAQQMGWKLLTCNHIEGLKELTEEHQAVLFDDIALAGLDEQQLLALVASDDNKQIRVLHGTVSKPAGLHQMITLNTDVLKKFKNKLNRKQYNRRLQFVLLDKPLIVNVNLNVQVNNHTHIYNNEELIADNERLFNNL